MSKIILKVMFCYEDGTPIPDSNGDGVVGLVIRDWSIDRELAELNVSGLFHREPTGQVTIRGVQTDGDQS